MNKVLITCTNIEPDNFLATMIIEFENDCPVTFKSPMFKMASYERGLLE
jgi:hypothetical protein